MRTTSHRLEASAVASQAYGRWLEIFQHLCPGMFDEAIRHLGQHVRCPLHGGEKDFRFIKRASNGRTTTAQTGVAMCTCGPFVDGFSLLQRATNKGFYEVLQDVNEYLNGHLAPSRPDPVPEPEKEAISNASLKERLQALWRAGKPIESFNSSFGPDFTDYFISRGLNPDTLKEVQNLRAISRLGYYAPPAKEDNLPQRVGSYPALLGLLQDPQDNLAAIHRTWLSEDKRHKAPVDCPKKLTQTISASGAAIRLFNADDADTLALCEGIETALAVREMSAQVVKGGLPVWACYSAGNLGNFQLPKRLKQLKRLIVYSDNDENETGLKAAQSLKKRFAVENPEIEVSIQLPEVMGWDWLDFLLSTRAA